PILLKNSQPIATSGTIYSEDLAAVGNYHLGLIVGYQHADQPLGWHLKVQYLNRGYEHLITELVDASTNRVVFYNESSAFLDFLPQAHYRINGTYSVNAGPYFSTALGRPNIISTVPDPTNRFDYGLNVGGSLHFQRFHLSLHYQRSLRAFDLAAFTANRSTFGIAPPATDLKTTISAVRLGVGYLLYR
ncbi:MAG: outer membrane beta-barrel protein, partial [Bacteroidota bacterium]